MLNFLLILYFLSHCSFINSQDQRKLDDLSDDILILHTNDIHCDINDTIGYDGFVLYREEMKKKYKYIISVDVGDHIQGGTLGAISNGSAIIKIMNEVGFNVSCIGNHEFDYGIEQLIKLEKNITSRYICANFCYKKNKTQIFEPYKIISINNKKIGFIGILTPLTFSKTYISQIKENGEPVYDFLTDNNGKELNDTIQNYINELRNEKQVDYVILLTHIGMKNKDLYRSDYLLSSLEGVDAVLDGHTHKVYNKTIQDKNHNDIGISQVGTKLESIGKLIINQDGEITSEIIDEIKEPNDKTKAISILREKKERWVDKNMNNFINSIWNEYSDILNIVYGYSDFDLYSKTEDKTAICRKQECCLGNLITDAIKEAGNGEVSLINGGALRNNLKKGNLTKSQIINVLPWFNDIVIKNVTGKCILDALEFGLAKWPTASPAFLQVSGLTFDVNENINSSILVDSLGMFVNVTGKRRVSNVKINGAKLNEKKYYNVALLEFIANGGDGYSMFNEFDVLREALITDTDAFSSFIEKYHEIPDKYKDLQGRINFIDGKNDEDEPSSHTKIILIICAIIVLIAISIIFIIFRGRICPKLTSKKIDSTNGIDIDSYSPIQV